MKPNSDCILTGQKAKLFIYLLSNRLLNTPKITQKYQKANNKL